MSEGAATYAALQQGRADGRIRRDEQVVLLFNCANGLKYPMLAVGRTLDRSQPIESRDRCDKEHPGHTWNGEP